VVRQSSARERALDHRRDPKDEGPLGAELAGPDWSTRFQIQLLFPR
jgi:hypothetical protein